MASLTKRSLVLCDGTASCVIIIANILCFAASMTFHFCPLVKWTGIVMGMSDCSGCGTVLASVVDAWTVGAGVLMGTTIVEGGTGVDGMPTRISR